MTRKFFREVDDILTPELTQSIVVPLGRILDGSDARPALLDILNTLAQEIPYLAEPRR